MIGLQQAIKNRAEELKATLSDIRHHLHKNPELSFKEFNTSEYICSVLRAHGISYRNGIAGTGVIGEIKGSVDGPIVALRADMDALPILENNQDKNYRSLNEGVMHACGHDVHMTCLLGALIILNEMKNQLKGTIRFIFQPGEELLPGGASLMIREGVLEGVSCIIGQHVQPSMESGTAGFREGMYMASTDELRVKVTGHGGHAAMPSDYNNPLIPLSRYILEATEMFMNRQASQEGIPTVIAFGKLEAAGATNVIPDVAQAEGTFRTMNETWREQAHQMLQKLAERISHETNTSCEIEISRGYPFLVNDPGITSAAREAAESYLGSSHVAELALRMTAEDFAWYTQKIPGCFYRLGTGNKEKGISAGVHTPDFDVDERSLHTGAGMMAYIGCSVLSSISTKK